jgi:hypothetical protein
MIERTALADLGLDIGRQAKLQAVQASKGPRRTTRVAYAVAMLIVLLGVAMPAYGQQCGGTDPRFTSVTNMQGTFTSGGSAINVGFFCPNTPTRFDPPFYTNTLAGGVFYFFNPTYQSTGNKWLAPIAIFADLGGADLDNMMIVGNTDGAPHTPGRCYIYWRDIFDAPNLYAWFSYSSTGTKTIKLTALECEDPTGTGNWSPSAHKVAEAFWTFEVTPPPQLSLFLDVDGIDLGNPIASDDRSWYVPCGLASGTSASPAALPQAITVVAAYLNSNNAIVAPPTTGDATLVLSEVSAFKGIAMNASTLSRDDLAFDFDTPTGGGTATASFSQVNNTARFTVNCWDYGGFAKATVTHGAGVNTSTASIHIPVDAGSNWIPDGGWPIPASGGFTIISDNLQPIANDDDAEIVPVGNNGPGDGLSRFEEYRGFVVKGVHLRTDPSKKDLFIYTEYTVETIGDASTLPLAIHEINLGDMSGPDTRLIAPNYQNYGYPGQDIPGHFTDTFAPGGVVWQTSDQRAVGVFRNTTVSSNAAFGSTNLPTNVLAGPPWAVGPFGSRVFQKVIHTLSPTHTQDQPEQSGIDSVKARQTIAHEVGHAINIPHRAKVPNYSCNSPYGPATTVMIVFYFPATNPKNSPSCAWNNIPHQYEQQDLDQLQIR